MVNRINRGTYIFSLLLCYCLFALAWTADTLLYELTNTSFDSNKYGMPFTLVFVILATIYLISAGAKRLHDIDRSGWDLPLALIPFYNVYFAGLIIFKKGDNGKNKYGYPIKGLVPIHLGFRKAWEIKGYGKQISLRLAVIILSVIFAIFAMLFTIMAVRQDAREKSAGTGDYTVVLISNEAELRKYMVDNLSSTNSDITWRDAECVTDTMIDYYTVEGLMWRINDKSEIFVPMLEQPIESNCGLEYTQSPAS